MAAIEISQMQIEDYDQIFALWLNVEGIGLHDYCDSRDGVARYLQRNPGLSFVARHNGKIVGTALCGHDGRRGYLHHLAIAQSHRKQGIAKTLIQQTLSALGQLGIAKCHLFVFSENDNAQEFWKNIGWSQRNDLMTMSKDIAQGTGE